MQRGRGVIEQPLQRLHDTRVLHMVQVIKHQYQLTPMLLDTLHQGDDPMLQRHVAGIAAKQEAGITDKLGVDLGKACLQAVTKSLQVVVFGCQRQPGDIEIQRQQLAPPAKQGAGLA
ncbi:hypothetical protein D3C78_988960 [compost metagenome]